MRVDTCLQGGLKAKAAREGYLNRRLRFVGEALEVAFDGELQHTRGVSKAGDLTKGYA